MTEIKLTPVSFNPSTGLTAQVELNSDDMGILESQDIIKLMKVQGYSKDMILVALLTTFRERLTNYSKLCK